MKKATKKSEIEGRERWREEILWTGGSGRVGEWGQREVEGGKSGRREERKSNTDMILRTSTLLNDEKDTGKLDKEQTGRKGNKTKWREKVEEMWKRNQTQTDNFTNLNTSER